MKKRPAVSLPYEILETDRIGWHIARGLGRRGRGDGEEVCDQLVACGDDIILFSDKQIEFPGPADSAIA